MRPLEWTIDDFVFVPQLDSDHQKVFQDAERVRQSLENGTSTAQIRFQVWRLSKTLATHFASEERAMRSSHYEAIQWHAQQHRTGQRKLAQLMEAAHRRDRQAVCDALEAFTHWLRDHVGLADRMFAAHMRNDRRERLVS